MIVRVHDEPIIDILNNILFVNNLHYNHLLCVTIY